LNTVIHNGENMSAFEDESYSAVFKSLRHPIRRKILRALSVKPQSFSDLQRTLGIESSHLTYHLEELGSLLTKTEKGEYALSSLGTAAVSTMKQVEEPCDVPRDTQTLQKFWRRERTRAFTLGIICLILSVSLVGAVAYHLSSMNIKDNTASSLKSQASALQDQLALANSTISSLNSKISELQDQLDSNNSMITTLQNQVVLANLTINSLKSQTIGLENELYSNSSAIAMDNATIANLQTQITNLQNEATSLQNQVNNLSKNSRDIVSSIPAGGAGSPPPTPGAPVYFNVKPIAIEPLVNANASVNGIEIPSSLFAIGLQFTVNIYLNNATITNVPAGIAGVYVDFDFANILRYCKPVGFTTMVGKPDGVLAGSEPLLSPLNGLFDANGAPIDAANYSKATQYCVAAAGSIWNNNEGQVAQITFQITGQPSKALNESDFYTQLHISYGELNDNNIHEVPYAVMQGTLRIDAAGPP